MPEIFSIPVDVTNPGQFYACCGLLELATALNPQQEVRGHFTDSAFVMNVCPRSIVSDLKQGTLEVRPLPEGSARVRGGAPHKVAPILVNGVLVLDWWLDESSADFKTWAGGMVAPDSLEAMHGALREADGPAYDRTPFDFSATTNAAAFCFDCRLGGSAIDIGGANRGRPTLKYVIVDLFAYIGLQRFRPAGPDRRIKTYRTWCDPLPAGLAAAVTTGGVPPLVKQAFRFRLTPRDPSFRYKSFGRAESVESNPIQESQP